MDVKIYTTPTCGYCHQAKEFLSQRGVKFIEHDVSQDRAAADEMVRLTGQMVVPVIVIDGQPVIGFDRPRLEQLIAAGGNGRRPRFGLKVADASRVAQKPGNIPVFGAVVGAVAPASPGEKAGLRAGDIITEMNMARINNANDLELATGGLASGSRVTIEFLRGQQNLRSEIVI